MKIQTIPSSAPNSASGALENSLTTLNQTLELNPENAAARHDLYETMQKLLHKDAFLAYLGETDFIYKVGTHAQFEFVHPKDRAMPEVFPPHEAPPAWTAINWLGWAAVGLIPAGLGTLVFAPLAVIAAFKLLQHPATPIDRRRAWVVIGGATALLLIALIFFFILILHLV